MLTAITLHYNPGVTAAAGPVAYLLAAGTAVDVVGFQSWELPTASITDAIAQHPRSGFKHVFDDAFRQEAARMPEGRGKSPAPVRRIRRRSEARAVRRVATDHRLEDGAAHRMDSRRTDRTDSLLTSALTE